MNLGVGGLDRLGIGLIAVEAVAALFEHAQRIETHDRQPASYLSVLGDGAVGADAGRTERGVQHDLRAAAKDGLTLFGGQTSFRVQGEGAVAGIGLAVGAVAHGEECAFAGDGEVQRAARLLHRTLAEVAADPIVQHKAGRRADRVVARPLPDLGSEHQLLDLEAGGVGVGDVVGHDVQFATQRHLA